MALDLVSISELDAINEMLTSTGGSPLSSIDDVADLEDASIARQTLHNISRELQSEGWHFNTEIEEALTPATSRTLVALPNDVTGITKANPGVVSSVAHGLAVGDLVYFTGLTEMTELNTTTQTVTAVGSADIFSINDTSSYGAAETTGGACASEVTVEIGEIALSLNTLGCDTVGANASLNVTIRGSKLYDLENLSFDFSAYASGLEVDRIVFLTWTALPEYVRRYIHIRAARKFQKKMLASSELENMTAEDEMRAFANFKNREAQNADFNVLTNTQVQEAWLRI